MSTLAAPGNVVKVFVGTSQNDRRAGAEIVLEHSIRKHCSAPVEFVWMRAGDTNWHVGPESKVMPDGSLSWNIGREPHQPPWVRKYPHYTCWTVFTPFRAAIPETAKSGRAIYLDSDQWCAGGDLAEVWNMPMAKPWVTVQTGQKFRVEMSLIDCDYFMNVSWYPSIEQQKKNRAAKFLARLLIQHDALAYSLDSSYNVMDRYDPNAKIYHATKVSTQPHKPWKNELPDFYRPHPDQRFANHWFDMFLEATGERHEEDIRAA